MAKTKGEGRKIKWLTKELYNEEFKQKFLIENNFPENIEKTYRTLLAKCSDSEIFYKKDVCKFNESEIEDLLRSFNLKSRSSYETTVSHLSKYFDFALSKGFLGTGINIVQTNFTSSMFEKYVNKVSEELKYTSRETLFKKIIDGICLNDQDAGVFALLFDGAYGEKMDELINLKETDIKEEGYVILTRNDGTTRRLDVSKKTFDILKDASEQMEYTRYLDDTKHNLNTNDLELVDSEYVFRPMLTKRNLDFVRENGLIARITKIKKLFGNKHLTVKSIFTSGQIHYAKELRKELGRPLTTQEYTELLEVRFGITKPSNIQRAINTIHPYVEDEKIMKY